MDKYIKQANKRGFKLGYAWSEFLKKVQIPTKYEIQRFAKIADYKKGWVYYQCKEFKIS